MRIKGTIYDISETQIISSKFRKREFVLMTGQGSLNHEKIPFTLLAHRINLIDEFRIGQYVEVNFMLRGREWDTETDQGSKYFLTAEARQIQSIENPYNKMAQPIEKIKITALTN